MILVVPFKNGTFVTYHEDTFSSKLVQVTK